MRVTMQGMRKVNLANGALRPAGESAMARRQRVLSQGVKEAAALLLQAARCGRCHLLLSCLLVFLLTWARGRSPE